MLSICRQIDPAGILFKEETMSEISGVRVRELAEQFGTPLYVYDESAMRKQLQTFTDSFRSNVLDTRVIYASKAFNCKAMIELVREYGCGLDVVSGGELYTALKTDFNPAHIYFHGNNKTPAEIRMALDGGVGTFVIDNEMEATELLKQIKDTETDVFLRINPGIEAHTHQYIVTAHVDSKFGFSLLGKDVITETARKLQASGTIHVRGIHAHIGSQIFDKQAYVELVRKMFAFAKELNDLNVPVSEINLGGGFGAYYTAEDHPVPVQEVCETILRTCEEENEKNGGIIRRILIEPGRSIVAEAGSTLYTVGYLKKTPNKHYVFVDGGMSDNIRPALYQAKYDAYVADRENEPVFTDYTVAGKCCESGDILIESIPLPEVHTGDILVVKTTGAYGYSMASHYNKLPFPAVVFVKDGKAREVIERESYEHMTALEKQEERS